MQMFYGTYGTNGCGSGSPSSLVTCPCFLQIQKQCKSLRGVLVFILASYSGVMDSIPGCYSHDEFSACISSKIIQKYAEYEQVLQFSQLWVTRVFFFLGVYFKTILSKRFLLTSCSEADDKLKLFTSLTSHTHSP